MNGAFSALFAPYNEDIVTEEVATDWTAILVIILLCLVVINCIVGGIYWYRECRVRNEKKIIHFVETDIE